MARQRKSARDPVTAYAENVLEERIVAGKLVKAACFRHVEDMQRGAARGLTFRPELASYNINFFRFLRHSKGEWAGKVVELAPWQAFTIGSAFGWLRRDGTRRFRTVYEEVARKNGKALAVETPIPTPAGWARHGDLRPGDLVFDPAGRPVPVLAVTEHYEGESYVVGFGDGTGIVAHARHEWRTRRSWYTKRPNGSRAALPLVETAEISATLRQGTARGDFVHAIDVAAALDLPDVALPIPPYTLGAWLGDGDSKGAMLTSADPEIVAAIAAEGVPIRLRQCAGGSSGKACRYAMTGARGRRDGMQSSLRRLGILGAKDIPAVYLRAGTSQRRDLLAGIVDTDGHVTASGQCEVVTVRAELADAILDLVRSLGLKPMMCEDRAQLNGRDMGPRYRIQFCAMADHLPLRVERKRAALRTVAPMGRQRSQTRMVTRCDPVGHRLVNCIEVAGGMYLAGPGMVPTHNSTKLAGVGLIGLIGDKEPGAEVYAAATKKEQARIIFGEASRMVRSSPQLARKIGVFKLNLHIDSTASKFEPLSSDEKTLDGLNPSMVLVDELHKHKNRALLDVLDTALGSRRQPLLWIITTAGDDSPQTPYAIEHEYARKVVEGILVDDSLFVYIAALDALDRWDDPKVWIKANPNLGVSVKLDDLKRQARAAKGAPTKAAAFKRLRLNLRTSSTVRAIQPEDWARSDHGPLDLDRLAGRRCWIGLDLSSKLDISAEIVAFPPEGADPWWTILPRFWVPAENVAEREDRDRAPYGLWIEQGFIRPTPGNVIDHSAIEDQVKEDNRTFDVAEVSFDPWNAAQMASRLIDEGLNLVEFIQGIRSYAFPTREFLAFVASAGLSHGGNPVLTWMASNLHTVEDRNRNIMPTKQRSTGRIDGISAAIMAIGRGIADDNSAGRLDDFLANAVVV